MPSKQFLMDQDEHKVCNCLEYGEKHLGVKRTLKSITYMADGQIKMVAETVEGEQFIGIGMSKCEAIAEALSVRFPVNQFPNEAM